jgi:hypothetical protein
MTSPVAYAQRYLDLDHSRSRRRSRSGHRHPGQQVPPRIEARADGLPGELLRKLKKDLVAGRKKDPGYAIKIRVRTDAGNEERPYTEVTSKENDPLWMLIRYPFAGKGSPEGIQAALSSPRRMAPARRRSCPPGSCRRPAISCPASTAMGSSEASSASATGRRRGGASRRPRTR